jgi:hypothetical protein
MKKGDFLIAKGSAKVYQIVGRWDRSVVLAPAGEDDEQVLIYTASELEELIAERQFSKLYKTGFKVGEAGAAQ